MPDAPQPDEPRLVIGLGASAGGLEALEDFFAAAPIDEGFAYIVVQHLSPDFKSLMEEILHRFTAPRPPSTSRTSATAT